MKTIKIGGKRYPFYQTMGAYVFFKRHTGIDVSEIKEGDITNNAIFIWAVCHAACIGEGLETPPDPDTFLCQLTPGQLAEAAALIAQESEPDDKKKA